MIKKDMVKRLFPSDTDTDQAWHELKALLGTRIEEGLAGKVSTKSIDEMVLAELQAAERLNGQEEDCRDR